MGRASTTAAKTSLSIIDQIGRAQIVLAILGITVPAGLSAVTVAAGITQHFPSMWVLMAASLEFMASIVSGYFLYHLIQIVTPANKLRYVATQINRDLTSESRRERRQASAGVIAQRNLDKIQLGVLLTNAGHFPISAILETAETVMEGETPPRGLFPGQASTILPGSQVFIGDDPIDMHGIHCGRMEGKMDITIKYGDVKNEKHTLRFKADVSVFMRADGLIETVHSSWLSA